MLTVLRIDFTALSDLTWTTTAAADRAFAIAALSYILA
jgi:hypothetical protein